jgi:hypothetical protein
LSRECMLTRLVQHMDIKTSKNLHRWYYFQLYIIINT